MDAARTLKYWQQCPYPHGAKTKENPKMKRKKKDL
jgi:hypothetical protein